MGDRLWCVSHAACRGQGGPLLIFEQIRRGSKWWKRLGKKYPEGRNGKSKETEEDGCLERKKGGR